MSLDRESSSSKADLARRSALECSLKRIALLTSTLVPGINYLVVIAHPLHQLQVRRRRSSSYYMIETYNTRHRLPCY